ncbi:MATE family efflux transporter [Sphingomonas sp.]|uniref:MATE family efflux transporter n=1 Tax=Sphingomonas sp. TaxID=28214 RepID=UPI002587D19C|nr:MATE family efflux transporter [Sphingomonas sp.]
MQQNLSPSLAAPPPSSVKDEGRALLSLAGPLVGANLLQMAIAAVDVIFVARLGAIDLAAATLAAFLFNLLSYALIGLTSAAAPLIAAERGRKAHAVRGVRRDVRMALWVGLIGAVPVMLLLWQGQALLLLAGQDAEVARRAGLFLRILLAAVPLSVAAGVMRIAAAALGRPGWAFLATGVALLVDIVGNWVLVFGHWHAPPLGLAGSALANLISFAVMTLTYAVILVRDPRLRRYRLFGRWWRGDGARARDICRIGLPIMATWMLEGGLFGGAALLMGLIGVTDVAAHAIALNIAAFAFQLPFGIAQAATIRVGLAYGAADRRWIALAGNVALAIGIGVMAVTATIIWTAPRSLIGLYIDTHDPANATVVALAVRFLTVAAVFQLADGAQAVAAGVLRGIQDTRVPMLIAAFGYWVVGFGSSVALGFATPLAGAGIWWGLAAGLLVVALLLTMRWRARGRLGLEPAPA